MTDRTDSVNELCDSTDNMVIITIFGKSKSENFSGLKA